MADALRAARTAPGFLDAVEVHLVESSPVLRARQAETLADAAPAWHDGIGSVPAAPAIYLANEFFDALPVHQYVRTHDGWSERRVGIAGDRLAFVAGAPVAEDRRPRIRAAVGAILEYSPDAAAIAAEIGRRLSAHAGAALVIDYGHAVPAAGETLQAVRRHRYADPLDAPGTADLTAHVDFAALAQAFGRGGARTFGPVTQGAFLCALGIRERTERLARAADPSAAARLRSATNRLINADQMGTLFKAMAATSPTAPPPAGFES